MNKNEKTYLLSKADKCAFFEKVFRELQIALVDSDRVAEVRWNEGLWLKKFLPKRFTTLERTAYCFNRYAVVWQNRSNVPVFMAEFDCPFDLFPAENEYDFFLRKTIDNKVFVERYTWQPSQQNYLVTAFPPDVMPAGFDEIQRQPYKPKEFSWCRLFPHKNVEVKSVDNTIFYDFIVNYAQK